MSESSKQIKIVGQILKELISKLDDKFESLSIVQNKIEKLETQLDNFRAYVERNNVQHQDNLKQIREMIQKSKIGSVVKQQAITQAAVQSSSIYPSSPIPAKRTSKKKAKKPTIPVISRQKPPSKSRSKTRASSRKPQVFSSLKETPLVSAIKVIEQTEDYSEDYYNVQESKKRTRKRTLRGYMEKVEGVCHQIWLVADQAYEDRDFQTFVDKGLTVLHGIIEFLFVGFRNEFPESTMDYKLKAKNISGLGLFKDTSLLDKMEGIYENIRKGKKARLNAPVVRGWHERLNKIYEDDFRKKIEEAYNHVR